MDGCDDATSAPAAAWSGRRARGSQVSSDWADGGGGWNCLRGHRLLSAIGSHHRVSSASALCSIVSASSPRAAAPLNRDESSETKTHNVARRPVGLVRAVCSSSGRQRAELPS